MNTIKHKRIFITLVPFVHLEIGSYFSLHRCYNNGVNTFISLSISWKLWLFHKLVTCSEDGGPAAKHMSSGSCPSLMFHDDLSFLCQWEPMWVSTCKPGFEEWSYEEGLRCQTSASSITLEWEPKCTVGARSINKLKFSCEYTFHACANLNHEKGKDTEQKKRVLGQC